MGLGNSIILVLRAVAIDVPIFIIVRSRRYCKWSLHTYDVDDFMQKSRNSNALAMGYVYFALSPIS